MRYLFFIIGLLLVVGAMANASLLYVGLIVLFLSAVFSQNSQKSVADIENKKEDLFDKLDKMNIALPDKAITNLMDDAAFVTANVVKGTKPDITVNKMVDATVNLVNGNAFKGK